MFSVKATLIVRRFSTGNGKVRKNNISYLTFSQNYRKLVSSEWETWDCQWLETLLKTALL
jgi:hypothetical protein